MTRQQLSSELKQLLSDLREPCGGYDQERRVVDLALGFLRSKASRRFAMENGLLSLLEDQAGGGSLITQALVPRLLLTFAPDGTEIHQQIALHHGFLPNGLAYALPQSALTLERLLRGDRPPAARNDSSDEESGSPQSSVQLDLIRVALDGAYFWVQLMLMLTYQQEMLDALAMKLLRQRNAELMGSDEVASARSATSERREDMADSSQSSFVSATSRVEHPFSLGDLEEEQEAEKSEEKAEKARSRRL